MRLIDADELINNINQDIEAFERMDKNYFADGLIGGLTLANKMIKKAPTIASDEDIKNFTLYNYPLKPGCDVKKEATAAAAKQVKEKFFELSEEDRIKAIIFSMRSNNKLLRTVLTDDDKDDSGLLEEGEE